MVCSREGSRECFRTVVFGLTVLLGGLWPACGGRVSLPGGPVLEDAGRDASSPDIGFQWDARLVDAAIDSGTAAVCGNGIPEPGEECDDGNTFSGDGCDAQCRLESPTSMAFRVDWLALRDPHLFVDVFGTCYDVTDEGPSGRLSVNEQITESLLGDADQDGYLDLNLVIVMSPYDDSPGGAGDAKIYSALCTAPVNGTRCHEDPASPGLPTTFENQGSGTCLSPYPGTTSRYEPPAASTVAPPTCLHTGSVDLSLVLGGVDVVLHHAQVAAVYESEQAYGLVSGLIRGFISEHEAQNIPVDLGLLGTLPLSDILQPEACGEGDDRDQDSEVEGTVTGWWFYLNFTASPVEWGY